MDGNILIFLEAYKSLDELCKQIFLSDRGISEYIDEMDVNGYGHSYVSSWDNDYSQLKRLRFIRNKLVHEINSFEYDLFSEEDIMWLKTFRTKIIERTDPLALSYQAENTSIETSDKDDRHMESETSTHPSTNQRTPVLKSVIMYIVWTVIILCVIILIMLMFLF